MKELTELCIYCWGHPLLYSFSGSVAVWMLLSGNLQRPPLLVHKSPDCNPRIRLSRSICGKNTSCLRIDRAGLNAFVRGLELRDPNVLTSSPDESPAHSHLAIQRGVTCLQHRGRTIGSNLLQRRMGKEHGQRARATKASRRKQ